MPRSIPLTKGQFAIVDDYQYEFLNRWHWRVNSKGYAIRSFTVGGKEIVVSMHREIMQPPKGLVVDHIDNDRLNNVRANLRVITQQQNLMNRRMFKNNTTGFKGVTYLHGKWHARIEKDGVDIHLGSYEDIKTAALVYDCAAVWLFGLKNVWRNLPQELITVRTIEMVRPYISKALSSKGDPANC